MILFIVYGTLHLENYENKKGVYWLIDINISQ